MFGWFRRKKVDWLQVVEDAKFNPAEKNLARMFMREAIDGGMDCEKAFQDIFAVIMLSQKLKGDPEDVFKRCIYLNYAYEQDRGEAISLCASAGNLLIDDRIGTYAEFEDFCNRVDERRRNAASVA